MVTIRDVAAHAGVGAGTVSRVLNDSSRVSAPTRQRVQEAIETLGYRPNPLARGLSRGRCQTIGVIVASFTEASAVERLRGVVAALDGSLYDLVLFNVESPLHRDEHVATLNRQRADGLLVMSLPLPPDQLEQLRSTGMAIVLVDGAGSGVSSVVIDDENGGRMATRHLVELGHERIGFIGDAPQNPFGFTSSARRERGYRAVLIEAGLGPDDAGVRYGAHDREVARDLALEILDRDRRPTAVFCCSDVQALGVMEAARALGLRVPDDVSVVGFDDVETSSYLGLTTVRQPLFRSGQLGAELLLRELENGDAPTPEADSHELPLELVVRSTTTLGPKALASDPVDRQHPPVTSRRSDPIG